jgi:hypothetical protein
MAQDGAELVRGGKGGGEQGAKEDGAKAGVDERDEG